MLVSMSVHVDFYYCLCEYFLLSIFLFHFICYTYTIRIALCFTLSLDLALEKLDNRNQRLVHGVIDLAMEIDT